MNMSLFVLVLPLLAGLVWAADAEKASIPRLIIQTGPKDTVQRDAKWGTYQASLRSMNPNFEIRYFDDDAALAFVDEHFQGTDLPRIYREAPKFVLKADLFRYAAVKILGGFYMDMDMLGKAPFEPLVDSGHGAVFPKEWWRSDAAYRKIYGGRECPDTMEHWQVGNYAFAAAPGHPFINDALDEAMARTVRLIKEKEVEDITDNDILLSTGPYMLSELYHEGRRNGKYTDLAHIEGDDTPPARSRSYGGDDWHKFGPYAEHMLSHSWVSRKLQGTDGLEELFDLYDAELEQCLEQCQGFIDLGDFYDFIEDFYGLNSYSDLYELLEDIYESEFFQCLIGCASEEEETMTTTIPPPTLPPIPPLPEINTTTTFPPEDEDTDDPTAMPTEMPVAAPTEALVTTKPTAEPTDSPVPFPTEPLPRGVEARSGAERLVAASVSVVAATLGLLVYAALM